MEVIEREENIRARKGSPLSCVVAPFFQIDGGSLFYNKLPEEPLNLTILKLDASSFHIRVARNGTVADLKQAVEAAFSDHRNISWPHVWGHFCLSYHGRKLLTDTDLLGIYQIKDGDKLSFMRHVSISYNLVKTRSRREDANMSERSIGVVRSSPCVTRRSPSQAKIASYRNARSKSCEGRQRISEQVDNHYQDDLLEKHQNHIHDNDRGVVANCESKLVNVFRGWFSYKSESSGRRITR